MVGGAQTSVVRWLRIGSLVALIVAVLQAQVLAEEGTSADAVPRFEDVPYDHPFHASIGWLVEAGLTDGYRDGTFRPTQHVTRQAAAALLYRLAGEPSVAPNQRFSDVPEGHPFLNEINWLVDQEIAEGYHDGTFRPTAAVTRQAAVAFLNRYAGASQVVSEDAFRDVGSDHAFAADIAWAVNAGITDGYVDGTFRPTAEVTRQAMAAFLSRYDAYRSDPDRSTRGAVWQRILDDRAVFGRDGRLRMYSVTAGGPGFVAVGVETTTTARSDPAIWTSTDGSDWQRIAYDEQEVGPGQVMYSVTAGGPGLVAVGYDRGRQAAAVWTSPDGSDWQRVPHDDARFGDIHQAMRSVIVGGPGLVAVGYDRGHDAAAVWTSVDGISWRRITHDEAVFGGAGPQWMNSVSTGGPGLVAVGGDGPRAAVWTSTDGATWERVAHQEAVFGGDGDQWIASVASGQPGLVAVGQDEGRSRPAVWTSTDGLAWQRVEQDAAVFDGVQTMHEVAAAGRGFVAVGHDQTRHAAAVWTSSDGSTWQRTPHDDAVFGGEVGGVRRMYSVTTGWRGLVAVGIDVDVHRGVGGAAVWTSP